MNSLKAIASLSALFFLFTCPALAKFNYPPNFPEAEVIAYKEASDTKLNLYVFKPKDWKASDKRGAIVFFFGGGWKAGSPEQFGEHCKLLAARGIVAITADYRVSSRNQTKAIDCLEDARDAMRWVREQAVELGVDPQKIAAGGGSAGGHLAACLGAIRPDKEEISSLPNALALFNPACMLSPFKGKSPWETDRTEELTDRMGTSPEKMSPVHHVDAKVPPCIIFHGKADDIVPYFTAESFAEELKKAGVRCELKGYKGGAHGYFNFGRDNNLAFEETTKQLDDFLVSLGWLSKKSESSE